MLKYFQLMYELIKRKFLISLVIASLIYGVFSQIGYGYTQKSNRWADVKSGEIELQKSALQTSQHPEVDSNRLLSHIKALSFERYTENERLRARDYITQELVSYGLVPEFHEYETGTNIVSDRLGVNDEAGVILLGAHYDTVRNSPGADDNASGVAAVLEAARLLSEYPTNRTLRVMFFDQEERIIAGNALIGSVAYVSEQENLLGLEGAVILEMVGYACYTSGCQRQPQWLLTDLPSDVGDFLVVVGDREHPSLLQAFQQQARDSTLPSVLSLAIPLKGLLTFPFMRSDHAPFWLQNIGAVMVTDTAYFRNPNYHQPSDIPETIDESFLTGTTQQVVNAIIRLLE